MWPDSIETHRNELNNLFVGNSDNIVKVYVAESESAKIVGFIELNLRSFAEGSRSRLVPYIEGWFVEKAHRNRGVGKSLIDKAEQWAKECGFNELASDTELENQKSIAIHKKLGFNEIDRIVCFLKKLNDV